MLGSKNDPYFGLQTDFLSEFSFKCKFMGQIVDSCSRPAELDFCSETLLSSGEAVFAKQKARSASRGLTRPLELPTQTFIVVM